MDSEPMTPTLQYIIRLLKLLGGLGVWRNCLRGMGTGRSAGDWASGCLWRLRYCYRCVHTPMNGRRRGGVGWYRV